MWWLSTAATRRRPDSRSEASPRERVFITPTQEATPSGARNRQYKILK